MFSEAVDSELPEVMVPSSAEMDEGDEWAYGGFEELMEYPYGASVGKVVELADRCGFDIIVRSRDGAVETKLRPMVRLRRGGVRRALPEGSPLEGMTEAEARAWVEGHFIEDVAAALGVTTVGAYRRLRTGRILPDRAPTESVARQGRASIPCVAPGRSCNGKEGARYSAVWQETIQLKERRPLPEGSPLEGMSEAEARAWAEWHTLDEISEALGISYAGVRFRLENGYVLPNGRRQGPASPIHSKKRKRGKGKRALPEGSPLEGKTEEEARAWAEEHRLSELADALGLSVSGARQRLASRLL